MSEGSGLWEALVAPFETFAFMRIALAVVVALALANGPVGVVLLMRRMALTGNVLAHGVMPGAALGFLVAGYSLFAMSLGGVATGLAIGGAAYFLGSGKARRETALVAFYMLSLASGVLLVALHGSQVDLMHVLFGTVLAVDAGALVVIAVIATITVLVLAAVYRPLALAGFDPLFLRLMTGGDGIFEAIFLLLVVLNLVAAVEALGTLLAAGPLLLSAAAARCWAKQPAAMMALSVVFGIFAGLTGLLVSFHLNLPSGPAMVLAGGALYAASLGFEALRARLAAAGFAAIAS
jgi:zinc/manganese transport system permease protein